MISLLSLCGLTLCITLTAGLWPFSTQIDNQVSRSADSRGLVFDGHAVMVSGGTFSVGSPGSDEPLTLELLLAPSDQWASSTILSFFSVENPSQFTVSQSGSDLALDLVSPGPTGKSSHKRLYSADLFHQQKTVLVTIVATASTISLYADGALQRSARGFGLSRRNCRGILLVGDSPQGNRTWQGEYRGLAFYARPLSAEEVAQHYQKWSQNPVNSDSLGADSLYDFARVEGDVLRNQGPNGPDLVIPKYYFRSKPAFLEPFWKEFTPRLVLCRRPGDQFLRALPSWILLCRFLCLARESAPKPALHNAFRPVYKRVH